MSPKDLLSVAMAAMAVWFISIAAVSMLAGAIGQEFSYLVVGATLLAIAGFVMRSRPLLK